MLSSNETVKRYVEYYDAIMERLEKKRVVRFDRQQALKMRNADTIKQVKRGFKSSQQLNTLYEVEPQRDEAKTKEETKAATTGESPNQQRRAEESKLWQVIHKQELRSQYSKASGNSPPGAQRDIVLMK